MVMRGRIYGQEIRPGGTAKRYDQEIAREPTALMSNSEAADDIGSVLRRWFRRARRIVGTAANVVHVLLAGC